MKIWINGHICEDKEAVVSAYDHGFLYGMGLFETFRTYNGRPFLLEKHLSRLKQGCVHLGIDDRIDLVNTEKLIAELLHANALIDAYIRLSVSAGIEELGLPQQSYAHPTIIMYMKHLPASDDSLYVQGKPLQLLQTRRNTPEGTIRFKSFHYMNNILAKRELLAYSWASGAEGLFLSNDGYIAEGIVSNLFFVKQGKCYTPSISTGILPGITRDFVIRMVSRMGMEMEEGLYTWEDLQSADEVFLTNSIQEIVPVTRLFDPQGHVTIIGDGTAGHLARQTLSMYRQSTQQS